jgi:thiol-disulfide isomerase/thioredoxin
LKHQIDSVDKLEGKYIKQVVLNTQCAYLVVMGLMNSQNGIATHTGNELTQLRNKFTDSKQVLMQLDINQKLQEHPWLEKSKPANGTYLTGFTLPNVHGKPISLDAFKGKYVLVDFWASWCAPCRRESPFLKQALERFGKNNFVILSVSIDENYKNWQKAIDNDGTSAFVHLIDNGGWKSSVLKQYNIESIPANFLLGPDGNILEKDLRGEKVISRLTQVLSTKY